MKDNLQLGTRDKVVQKMTQDGLIEDNLSQHSRKRVSARAEDADFGKPRESAELELKQPSKTKMQQRRYRKKLEHPEIESTNVEEVTNVDVQESPVSEKSSNASIETAAVHHTEQPLREKSVRSENHKTDQATNKAKSKKKQRKRIYEEQKKQGKTRLSFDDEAGLYSASEGLKRKAVAPITTAGAVISAKSHEKVSEYEDDNVGVEAAHKAEQTAENVGSRLRSEIKSRRTSERKGHQRVAMDHEEVQSKQSKLRFDSNGNEETHFEAKKRTMNKNKEAQKKRYRREYAKKKSGKQAVGTAASKAKTAEATETLSQKVVKTVKNVVKNNKVLIAVLLCGGIITLMIANAASTAGTIFATSSEAIFQSSYLSSDDEIRNAEEDYAAMEAALQRQIDNIERDYPGYDEYRVQVDEISHNPYHLASYLTVKYGNYTASQVQDELDELFRDQYSMSIERKTETVTDTRTVRVGESLGNVVTSGYCNCRICCGSWSGEPTASGRYPTANHTIAVDANNPIVPMGTKIVMNGIEYTVEDTGNFARYGVDFDVYYDSHAAASMHGHKTWQAYISDANGSQSVEVTQTRIIRVLNVSMTNKGFDTVAMNRLSPYGEKATGWYNLLNQSLGNRDYLWDVNQFAGYHPGGMSYDIPPEALSDHKFANMIHEAEKYLGYPYVWGGASPSTSFDCSGFVSWVINHCGNGWDYGRCTADGLRGICTYVPPAQAKPGDLIFFQGTYNTSGASHVGIYVGNGMMIHCGNPIQYASINTNYWQQHFMCFGRLP